MTGLAWAPLVFLDVIFALICVGAFQPSQLKSWLGRLARVNFFGSLKAQVMKDASQKLHMAPVKVRLQSGRPMRLLRTGSLKRNSRATWVVSTEYNGVSGKRQLNTSKKRLRTTSAVNTTGAVRTTLKRRIK